MILPANLKKYFWDRQIAPETLTTPIGGHIPELDGLRGFAIVTVMLYHFTVAYRNDVSTIIDTLFIRICGAGWLGVDLFFVLSGFLITGILLDTRQSGKYFTSFYARRFLRIFPIYYAIMIVFFFILPGFIPIEDSRLNVLLDNKWWFLSYLLNWKIAFIGNFNAIPAGYIWSLAIEEQFYIIWPWIVFSMPRKLLSLTTWSLAGCVILRTGLLLAGVTATSVYVMTFSHLDGLLIGAFIAVYIRTRSIDWRLYCTARIAIISSFLILILLFIQKREFYFYTRAVAYIGFILLALGFGGLLTTTLFSDKKSLLRRIMNGKLIRSFGKYSYCLYLIHHPVGTAIEKVLYNPSNHSFIGSLVPAFLFYIILTTIICWVLAFISWNLFEKQLLKLKSHFNY
jgi:peptidoglycan/LPS O-acetylase OafA/YrhL